MNRIIKKNYTQLSHPTAFGGRHRVLEHYKRPGFGIAQAEKALSYINSYTKYREAKTRARVYNPYFLYGKRDLLQADLLDVSEFAAANNGVRFLLACIDCWTKKVWMVPLKSKRKKPVAKAFRKILDAAGVVSGRTRLMTDFGFEFRNDVCEQLLRDKGVRLQDPNQHCSFIERFHLTFQRILHMFLAENETSEYTQHLPDLLSLYLNRKHRSIGMSPEEAEKEENQSKVQEAHEKYRRKRLSQRKPAKYQEGIAVRVLLDRGKFRRGYHQRFGNELYKISQVHTRMPIPSYSLKSMDTGEEQAGRYYENEMQPVLFDREEGYRIDRVLRSKGRGRRKMLLVKWIDFEKPEWVPAANITKTYNANAGDGDKKKGQRRKMKGGKK